MMTYKQHCYTARFRKVINKLTEAEHAALLSGPCFYCGGKAGGIDRKDPSMGYALDNCVSACKRCNARKQVYEPLGFEAAMDKAKELAYKNAIPPPSQREWRKFGPWYKPVD